MTTTIITQPLTATEAEALAVDGQLTVIIKMELDDFIDVSLDEVMTQMETAVVENHMLSNLSYTVVGFEADNVLLVEIDGVLM